MSNYIFCCECPGTSKYAEDAAKMLLPKYDIPKPTLQKDMHSILDEIPKNTKAYIAVEKLIKRRDKFALYMSISENGVITEAWDLLKSRRIKCQ